MARILDPIQTGSLRLGNRFVVDFKGNILTCGSTIVPAIGSIAGRIIGGEIYQAEDCVALRSIVEAIDDRAFAGREA